MTTPRIIVLDDITASKIAAGEVIERPASVIKELLENSLDAGAGKIEVEVEEGGSRLLRVRDDGGGMTAQEAILSLQRHATSKLRCADDLFAITTLGFRGEALPSIASVARFELLTRAPQEEVGCRLLVEGGEVKEIAEVGLPPGTTISVSGLFYNTPARLKFLRSQTTEFAHIAELINRFAFSHPQISFLLRHNGREVLRRPANPDLREALAQLLGREPSDKMRPVNFSSAVLNIRGFVSPPDLNRASRNQQYFFVNRRWVRNRMLTHVLAEAYRATLPLHRHPVAVLLLDLEPSLVDVNVHPTKAEVRFSREGEIYSALRQALQTALSPAGLATAPSLSGETYAEVAIRQNPLLLQEPAVSYAPPARHPAFQPRPAEEKVRFRPLAQLRRTYILAEGDSGLLVIDQHRAHERVLYEQFSQAERPASQHLLTPVSVQLRPKEASVLKEALPQLQALGFELEEFGAETFLVRAMPAVFIRLDPAGLLTEIVETLLDGDKTSRREKTLITMACKAAVKAGDELQFPEMTELLRALADTGRPYTCPHGRPTVMTISNFELDKKFHR
jgi:DNA mismatch repair protein MutL